MNFFNYYQQITDKEARQNLRNDIVRKCRVQPSTFYAWFIRQSVPKWHQDKIAQIIGKPKSELF